MWTERTQLLYGDEKFQRIRAARVLVVGTGGVGSYAAEMLCRAGIGHLTLVDADTVQPSNINRQLPALHSTIGRAKAEVLAERFRDMDALAKASLEDLMLLPDIGLEVARSIRAFFENEQNRELLERFRTLGLWPSSDAQA